MVVRVKVRWVVLAGRNAEERELVVGREHGVWQRDHAVGRESGVRETEGQEHEQVSASRQGCRT